MVPTSASNVATTPNAHARAHDRNAATAAMASTSPRSASGGAAPGKGSIGPSRLACTADAARSVNAATNISARMNVLRDPELLPAFLLSERIRVPPDQMATAACPPQLQDY